MRKTWLFILTGVAVVALSGAAQAPQHAPRKQVIQAKGAPPSQTPFSPALLVGDTLYLSGALGLNPATGQLPEGGFEPELRQLFANTQSLLDAAGMQPSDVVSTTVYLGDMKDFPQLNQIYREYFKTEPLPTRSTVAVKELARSAHVEITMTAVRTSQ
ncbi:MAG TPA: Rid family detoxifying hydrolase [Candidatus Acidoferrales bacterium]|nr:Rid family detoxifying hydrolase [Candidatus Acidoferrales bacterium]